MIHHWHSHKEKNTFFPSSWTRVSEEYLSYFHKVFSGYSTLTELMTLKQSGNSSSDVKEVEM